MVRRWQSLDSRAPRKATTYLSRWVLALLVVWGGCKSSTKTALIEAELRTREREIRSMRTELERATLLNSALQHELIQRNGVCAPVATDGVVIDGPQSVLAGTVSKVLLGRGTGGIDDDGLPGDEALQVVIVPVDTDGSALKVPGKAVVQAFEITPEGLKIPLSQWEVTPLELQRSWRSGLLTTGYFITLPWKVLPSNERLRVVVQFQTLPNLRTFETDRDLTIKLTTGRVPRQIPPSTSLPQPVPLAVPPSTQPPQQRTSPSDGPILGSEGVRLAPSRREDSVQSAKPSWVEPTRRVRLLGPVLVDGTPEVP